MESPPSLQLQSVAQAFGQQGWHCEPVEGREVLEAHFEAHHTHIQLHAQAFAQLNALSIVAECPLTSEPGHLAATLELLMRANKQLTLGSFEFDIDRQQLVFRITNLFDRERFDADIVCLRSGACREGLGGRRFLEDLWSRINTCGNLIEHGSQ